MADSLKAKDKVENPKAQFGKPNAIIQDKALPHMKRRRHLTLGSRTSDSY
jgi:hypothetical protein